MTSAAHSQDRPKQELGVVQRGIGEDILLDDERPGVRTRRQAMPARLPLPAEIAAWRAPDATFPGKKYCLL